MWVLIFVLVTISYGNDGGVHSRIHREEFASKELCLEAKARLSKDFANLQEQASTHFSSWSRVKGTFTCIKK